VGEKSGDPECRDEQSEMRLGGCGCLRVTWLLQSIVLLLNRTPLKGVLSRIYDLGVHHVVSALSKHPAVFCILGTGSYFEKRVTYGLSDVDLIIVLHERVTRADAGPREIAYTYERVRRMFPFLGRWHEKEANLIFLSDIAAGFPAPDSFRIRFKQGRLVPLYGDLPGDIVSGAITSSEVIAEIDTLLRFSLVADPRHARRLVFWKRVFAKLIALAELLDLPDLSKEMEAHRELRFLAEDDIQLFFRNGDRGQLFSLLLVLTRRIFDAVAAREPKVKIQPVAVPERAAANAASGPLPRPFSYAFDPANDHRLSIRHIPSVPIGLAPRMLYFSVDDRIPLLELNGVAYDAIQRLRHAEPPQSLDDENALVSAEGFLFIATRQPRFVDVIPLDPLQFANVYAAAFGDSLEFAIPASILAEQQAIATDIFRGLAHMYRANDGTVTKLPHPCIYREHDAEVIENALRVLRVRVASAPEWISIQHSSDLFEYLRSTHPECAHFLSELERYQRSQYGDLSLGETRANNLYRCLHQFMSQALIGAATITVAPPHQHLGISVGVITRNRAGDLAEMLDSLTRQMRPPDEVLVVDNGSTDHTQAVLEGFRDRLPIRCQFLEQADIPGARNLVIESAAHDIVSFIDDDCISEPEWLAAVEQGFLRADNIGIVGGWVRHEPAPRRSTVDNYYRVFHHTKS
jgi:hypothetical protein